MEKIKLTKFAIDRLPMAEKGKQVDYFDTELKGFGCRISATSKTFFVLKRVKGKLARVTLGKYGVMTPDKARKDAIETLAAMNKGINLNQEKAKARERTITLSDTFDRYLTARPNLKPRTIAVDKSLLSCHFSDWSKKPITEISKEMISRRHLKIAKEAGEVTANNAMRLFRRLYNFSFSISEGGEMPPNPVQRLSDTRQWFKVDRRQTCIMPHELPKWYQAVREIENQTIQDYLLFLLFTGLRKNEALSLQWGNIDMEGKTFTIPKGMTKNRKPHTLPMSSKIFDIFMRRSKARENNFVFPGSGLKGHLIEPKRQVQAVSTKSGKKFCLHDLRRTFASIAETVVSYAVLKRLLNHSHSGDVTQGYLVITTEKLRVPMQSVTETIMQAMEPPEPGKVLLFKKEGRMNG